MGPLHVTRYTLQPMIQRNVASIMKGLDFKVRFSTKILGYLTN